MKRFGVLWVLAGCGGGGSLWTVFGFGTDGSIDVVAEQNNYSLAAHIRIDSVQVAAQTDFTVDWSAFTTDLRGRPFDGQADEVSMVRFDLDKEAVLAKLDTNTLLAQDAPVAFLFDVEDGVTGALISQFEIIGNHLNVNLNLTQTDPAHQNWLITVSKTPSGRLEALTSKFVDLVTGADGTEVVIEDDCAGLDLEVDLGSAMPVQVPSGRDDYTMDWSDLRWDVFGNAFDPITGDELLVARFDVDRPEDIEAFFMDLDGQAAELYRLSVFGVTSADLMAAEAADGTPFGGFTDEGVWLLGIGCTQCLNPAPLFLTVVDVL